MSHNDGFIPDPSADRPNKCERCANEMTSGQLWGLAGLIFALCIGLATMLYVSKACADDTSPLQILNDTVQHEDNSIRIFRGGGEDSLHVTEENGVTVIRGIGDYQAAPAIEAVEVMDNAKTDMDAWFRAYDAWRARWIYRKLHPRP